MTETIRWEKDADGIVTLTMDDPNQSANTMNRDYLASMAATVDRLYAEKDDITGVVLTSAKKTFFAGGDLNVMSEATADQAQEGFDSSRTSRPAASPGDARQARGRGHQRRGARRRPGDRAGLPPPDRGWTSRVRQIGLPEVTLGLLPGGGGVIRTVRLLGIQNALLSVLLQGQRHKPAKALEVGLVHELVAGRGRAAAEGQGVDQGQPRGRAAVGRQGLQDPRRHAVAPVVRRQPARVPGEPAQAAQGREHAGAAQRSCPPPSRARRSTSTPR